MAAARQTTTTRARATSSRTTAPKLKRPKIDLDLGAKIDGDIDDDDAEPDTKTLDLWGEPIVVRCRVNEFLLSAALGGDNRAATEFFESIMDADNYRRFRAKMAAHPNMTTERYAKVFAYILEAISSALRTDPPPDLMGRAGRETGGAPRPGSDGWRAAADGVDAVRLLGCGVGAHRHPTTDGLTRTSGVRRCSSGSTSVTNLGM